jgi:hypothetical protein
VKLEVKLGALWRAQISGLTPILEEEMLKRLRLRASHLAGNAAALVEIRRASQKRVKAIPPELLENVQN